MTRTIKVTLTADYNATQEIEAIIPRVSPGWKRIAQPMRLSDDRQVIEATFVDRSDDALD